ncbi:hypothetical protein KKF84_09060 [Myxococcota bacterium]|nr:hypothetical protein [Myxococcota bacterium]
MNRVKILVFIVLVVACGRREKSGESPVTGVPEKKQSGGSMSRFTSASGLGSARSAVVAVEDSAAPEIDPEIAGLMQKQATGAGVVTSRVVLGSRGHAPFYNLSWGSEGKGGHKAIMKLLLKTSVKKGSLTLASTRQGHFDGTLETGLLARGLVLSFRLGAVKLEGRTFFVRELPGKAKLFDFRSLVYAMEKGMELTGLTRRFWIDHQGVLSRTDGAAPSSMQWVTGEMTQVVEGIFRSMVVAFPGEALGRGAAWSVHSTGKERADPVTYALVSVGPQAARVSFSRGGLSGEVWGCFHRLSLKMRMQVRSPFTAVNGEYERIRDVDLEVRTVGDSGNRGKVSEVCFGAVGSGAKP